MDLTNKGDIEKATDFIKKKYQGCPNCGALNAAIHNVVGMPVFTQPMPYGSRLDKLSIAALPLICDNCGCITFFAAKNILQPE